jgi:hypothetical protein
LSSIGGRSTTPPQISDPFTERLDIISMNHKHQTAELEGIREKLRHANSQINTFSALNIRQKDEEVAELRQQVDIHKVTIKELRKKQDLTTSVVDDLQARIKQLEGAGTSAGEEDASFAVGRGMNSMRGEMIDMEQRIHAEYTRKEELEGLESGMEKVINEFINGINKQLVDSHRSSGALGNRVAELEKRKLDERLGRLEGVTFELLTAALSQAKLERNDYEDQMESRRREMDRLYAPTRPVHVADQSGNEARETHRREMDRMIAATQPISITGPSSSTRPTGALPDQSIAEKPANIEDTTVQESKSSRVIAPLPRRRETEVTKGAFASLSAVFPDSSSAVAQDPVIERYEAIQNSLKDAIDILTVTGDDRYSKMVARAEKSTVKDMELTDDGAAQADDNEADADADDSPQKSNDEDTVNFPGDTAQKPIELDTANEDEKLGGIVEAATDS